MVPTRVTHTAKRVSISSAGVEANANSLGPAISADGRYVAFGSRATNLVANDTNGTTDIFVHDRVTDKTERVSRSSAGVEGIGGSSRPAISADGRYVAFESYATNLVASDTNFLGDVFVRDRATDRTKRVSLDSAGREGDSVSFDPAISADGRYVAFESYATNLVASDTNGTRDVFRRGPLR